MVSSVDKKLFFVVFFVFMFLIVAVTVLADETFDKDKICIVYFYGDGCPHCAKVKPVLEALVEKYSDKVELHKYEVYHDDKGFRKYNEFCSIKSIPLKERGIPLLAIGNKFYMGDEPIINNLEKDILEMIKSGERTCPLTGEELCHEIQHNNSTTDPLIPGLKEKISLPLVIITGAIDGINPCAIGVMIFLAAFLMMVSSSRKRIFKVGGVYIISVYITYLLAGIGLLYILQSLSFIRDIVIWAFAAILVVGGIINIKDYFWYGKGVSLKIPESKKKKVQAWITKASVPSAIILGFLVSAWELPCTGGVYLGILALMSNTLTKMQAFWYLLVYNILFVMPLIVILFLFAYGMTEETLKSWLDKHKKTMKLAMGIIMIILAVVMFWFL